MSERTEKAILAGGCFWGMQDLIRKRPGVLSTRVGYTGGDVPNATYRNHAGHAEAIEIIFDPAKISFRQILEFFFQIHDPTTVNRQGNDLGTSYRSAIFYTSDEQRRIAECIEHMRSRGATLIEPSRAAEEAWVGHVGEAAGGTLRSTCSSWYVGANIPGKPRVFMPYIGGFPAYIERCEAVVKNGYEGFSLV